MCTLANFLTTVSTFTEDFALSFSFCRGAALNQINPARLFFPTAAVVFILLLPERGRVSGVGYQLSTFDSDTRSLFPPLSFLIFYFFSRKKTKPLFMFDLFA